MWGFFLKIELFAVSPDTTIWSLPGLPLLKMAAS